MNEDSLILIEAVRELLRTKAIADPIIEKSDQIHRNAATLDFLARIHPEVDQKDMTLGQLMTLVLQDLNQICGEVHFGATCPSLIPRFDEEFS